MLVVLTEKKIMRFGFIFESYSGDGSGLVCVRYGLSHGWSSCGDSDVGDFKLVTICHLLNVCARR